MNKKIAMSGLSIVAALTIMGGATFAQFSDSATVSGNTFSTGDSNLQIAANNAGIPGTYGESITGPTFTGIFPGQTKTFEFWLKNSSTAAINLDLLADVSAINPTDNITQTIDNVLLISWVCDTDGNGGLADNTPSSAFSPRDWFEGGNAALGSLEPNEEMICRMFGNLPLSADNTVANQSVAFDVRYDATQVVP